ncbi:MAG: hypothetical protein QOH08_49 [Chloroflexota bacterium]|jgi:DNA-directed RNA polymerase subunit RPC12/RpoP|nr:hypothetical protein [Chloroflexota bacterium]
MDRSGSQREAWVTCPACGGRFPVERAFWSEPVFADVPLHCPRCHREFAKEEAPQTWGAATAVTS